jgi:TATA-box binding protein (TBP) (component of TFIID and TFIIIB)
MANKSKFEVAIDSIKNELSHENYNKGYVSGLIFMVTEHITGLIYASRKFRCTSFGDACHAEAIRLAESLIEVLKGHPDYEYLKEKYG